MRARVRRVAASLLAWVSTEWKVRQTLSNPLPAYWERALKLRNRLMNIRVTVPGLLAASIGGSRHFDIEATTLADAISRMKTFSPALAAHLFDEAGAVRQHILLYLNDESVTWIEDHAARELRAGDELFIIQAVSGG